MFCDGLTKHIGKENLTPPLPAASAEHQRTCDVTERRHPVVEALREQSGAETERQEILESDFAGTAGVVNAKRPQCCLRPSG